MLLKNYIQIWAKYQLLIGGRGLKRLHLVVIASYSSGNDKSVLNIPDV